MSTFDICVRGSGIVGLSAALACARAGLAVAVAGAPAPAQPGAAGDVRAYALNAGAVALLRQLKVWEALPADARTPVYDMAIRGDAHGSAMRFSAWQQAVGELAFIVDAAALHEELMRAARYAAHVQWVGEEGVEAPLQVLAEGKASATRQALGVPMPMHRYGQTAVAARLTADQVHEGVARQWFRAPQILALLPFDRPTVQHSYALVWSVSDEEARSLLALDVPSFEAALNEATAGAAGSLRLRGERQAWPLMQGRAQTVSGPGWVLVGDCAHVVHPLAGQGVNLGLADVAALAAVLAAREPWRALGDERLLRRYAQARWWPTQAMAHTVDGLWHLFAHPHPLARELRNRGMTLVEHLSPLKRLLVSKALHS